MTTETPIVFVSQLTFVSMHMVTFWYYNLITVFFTLPFHSSNPIIYPFPLSLKWTCFSIVFAHINVYINIFIYYSMFSPYNVFRAAHLLQKPTWYAFFREGHFYFSQLYSVDCSSLCRYEVLWAFLCPVWHAHICEVALVGLWGSSSFC